MVLKIGKVWVPYNYQGISKSESSCFIGYCSNSRESKENTDEVSLRSSWITSFGLEIVKMLQ